MLREIPKTCKRKYQPIGKSRNISTVCSNESEVPEYIKRTEITAREVPKGIKWSIWGLIGSNWASRGRFWGHKRKKKAWKGSSRGHNAKEKGWNGCPYGHKPKKKAWNGAARGAIAPNNRPAGKENPPDGRLKPFARGTFRCRLCPITSPESPQA